MEPTVQQQTVTELAFQRTIPAGDAHLRDFRVRVVMTTGIWHRMESKEVRGTRCWGLSIWGVKEEKLTQETET